MWLHSSWSVALDSQCWPTGLSLLGRKGGTALVPSRSQGARANPNQEKTPQKEVVLSKEVWSCYFLFQVAQLCLDLSLDIVPQEGLHEALEFCVNATGSALPAANKRDLVNSWLPEEVNGCFLSFKWFQTQPLQRAESSLNFKETTSERTSRSVIK